MSLTAILASLVLPYGIQPGGTVAFEFTLVRPSERVAITASPRVGAYARPEHFVRGIVGGDAGFLLGKAPVHHGLTAGLAYLPTGRIASTGLDLATGTKSPTWRGEHLGLVQGAYTFMHMPVPQFGWTVGLAVGSTLTGTLAHDALFVQLNVGVRFGVAQ